jgi:hypothetical protein
MAASPSISRDGTLLTSLGGPLHQWGFDCMIMIVGTKNKRLVRQTMQTEELDIERRRWTNQRREEEDLTLQNPWFFKAVMPYFAKT